MAREQSFYMAELSKNIERYDDTFKFMEDVITAAAAVGSELTDEERVLLSIVFQKVVEARHSSWQIVSSVQREETRDELAPFILSFKEKIENELSFNCHRILRLLENLIPSASDSKAFYFKMVGDCYRYLAELKTDKENDAVASRDAYEHALATVMMGLTPSHPIRLDLALSISLFLHNKLESPELARNFARKAHDEAMETLESLTDEQRTESVLIMQKIRDNLALWNAGILSASGMQK